MTHSDYIVLLRVPIVILAIILYRDHEPGNRHSYLRPRRHHHTDDFVPEDKNIRQPHDTSLFHQQLCHFPKVDQSSCLEHYHYIILLILRLLQRRSSSRMLYSILNSLINFHLRGVGEHKVMLQKKFLNGAWGKLLFRSSPLAVFFKNYLSNSRAIMAKNV